MGLSGLPRDDPCAVALSLKTQPRKIPGYRTPADTTGGAVALTGGTHPAFFRGVSNSQRSRAIAYLPVSMAQPDFRTQFLARSSRNRPFPENAAADLAASTFLHCCRALISRAGSV